MKKRWQKAFNQINRDNMDDWQIGKVVENVHFKIAEKNECLPLKLKSSFLEYQVAGELNFCIV